MVDTGAGRARRQGVDGAGSLAGRVISIEFIRMEVDGVQVGSGE